MSDPAKKPIVPAPAAGVPPDGRPAPSWTTPPPGMEKVPWTDLPSSVQRELFHHPRDEWHRIESVFCSVDTSRDSVQVLRFLDPVIREVRNRIFTRRNRITGPEIEQVLARLESEDKDRLIVAADLAGRAHLTQMLQMHRGLLRRFGLWKEPPPAAKPVRPAEPATLHVA
jgi:hypothetical protein